MIGIDWGTTSLRAYRLDEAGAVLDRRESAQGILSVPGGGFAAVLEAEIRPWLDAGETLVLLCGMIGSRQGWQEAPYLPCPAGPAEIAAAAVPLRFAGARALPAGAGPLHPRAGRRAGRDARRGNQADRAAGGAGRRGGDALPARHPQQVGAAGRRARGRLRHADDGRDARGAARPQHPRPALGGAGGDARRPRTRRSGAASAVRATGAGCCTTCSARARSACWASWRRRRRTAIFRAC